MRESRPKDEHWRLEVEFSDGAQRTLLSSFVTLPGGEADTDAAEPETPVLVEPAEEAEAEPDVPEPEEAEPVAEAEPKAVEEVEAEPELVEAEPVEVEAEPEPVPEPELAEAPPLVEPVIIEAEMVDEPPVATAVIEPQAVPEVVPEVPLLAEPVVVDLGDPDLESDPEVSAMGSLETKRASGRGRSKGQKVRCRKCGGEGHYAKTCTQ